AKFLESKLELPTSVIRETKIAKNGKPEIWPANGGLFSERPPAEFLLFHVLKVKHDAGLALVYGAAFAGWTYLIVRAAFSIMDRPPALSSILALVAAIAVGNLVKQEVVRHDDKQKKPVRPGDEEHASKPAEGAAEEKPTRRTMLIASGLSVAFLLA